MAKHPKLENLDSYFSKGEDFELTDSQYEKKTGSPLPKTNTISVQNHHLHERLRNKVLKLK